MLRRLVFAACLGLIPLVAVAQREDTGARARPTVGLVLSGGSAKGLAHIGAIRVIEEAGIPVDVVAGTSAGSILGSLYAMGYSTEQMTTIVREMDWASLFTEGVARSDQGALGRLGEGAAIVSLPIRDGRPTLPSGLVAGQEAITTLSEQAWPARTTRDFADLPRSFVALAVDAETGEAVPITSGSVPFAVRASMALPTLFAPFEIDGRLYVDGGIARNLPAEDALALGADVLVCVDVSDDETSDSSTPSLVELLVAISLYASERDRPNQRALCDVLIDPDVGDLSSFAFDAAEEWIARGEAAAQDQRAALDALAERLGHPPLDAPPTPDRDPAAVAGVEVEGLDGAAERFIRAELAEIVAEGGGTIAPRALRRFVERLYATGAFALITYRFEVADDGAPPTLVLRAEPDDDGRFGFGFRYDTQYNAALLFELEQRSWLIFGSEAQFDVRLGDFVLIGGRYIAGVGLETPWTFGLTGGYVRAPLQAFLTGDRPEAAGFLRIASFEAYTGPVLFGTLATAIGARLVWNESAPEVAAPGIPSFGARYASFAALAVLDTRDRVDLPRSGVDVFLAADASPGLGLHFQRVLGDLSGAVRLAPSVSVGARAFVSRVWGMETQAEASPDQFVHLGGPTAHDLFFRQFVPLYGAEPQQFIAQAGMMGRIHLHLENTRGLFARAALDAGYARSELTLDREAFHPGYGVSVGANTFAGPFEMLFYGEAFADRPSVLLRFGRRF